MEQIYEYYIQKYFRFALTSTGILIHVTMTSSFMCCINLRINHSYYSLYYCILAFTHSCRKLHMSTFNKDQ